MRRIRDPLTIGWKTAHSLENGRVRDWWFSICSFFPIARVDTITSLSEFFSARTVSE